MESQCQYCKHSGGSHCWTGIIPLSSTQDIGGPLARNVTDLALILGVVAGYDPADSQTDPSFGRFERSCIDVLAKRDLLKQAIYEMMAEFQLDA